MDLPRVSAVEAGGAETRSRILVPDSHQAGLPPFPSVNLWTKTYRPQNARHLLGTSDTPVARTPTEATSRSSQKSSCI